MNPHELNAFVEALREATELMTRAQDAVRRGRAHCHGPTFDHVDVVAKRLYEIRTTCEWLHRLAAGGVPPPAQRTRDGRLRVDRRQGIDRRVVGMRNGIFGIAS
jgi:hypothetical protein